MPSASRLLVGMLSALAAAAMRPWRPSLTFPSTNCTTFTDTLSIGNTTVINATYHDQTANQTSYCEVYSFVSYGDNDTLTFSLWLPDNATYADRFMAVGNGGFGGTIDFDNMDTQFSNGYGMAVAGSDAGHSALSNGVPVPGTTVPYLHDTYETHAWIHNAIAIFTPVAKTIVEAYYARAPRYSYFNGCSTGGGQGFALAQYHPDMFHGIYAGSPGNLYSHLILSFLWNAQQTNTTETSINLAQLNDITNAAIEACDALDGVQDGVLENPLKCDFDLDTMACNRPNAVPLLCLTPTQLKAAKAIYAGPTRSDDGSQVYPGFSYGSEIGWTYQEGLLADAFTIPILQNLVYDDLEYNADTFNWASDVSTVDTKAGLLIDARSPDLNDFRHGGGKLISTQGWADPINAAIWPIEHLAQMQQVMGGNVSQFFRLFMVPGGGHCGSQPHYPNTPGTYHVVPALVEWVEAGQAPSQMLSSEPPVGNATHKLCPWPETAHYQDGDTNNWANYLCY